MLRLYEIIKLLKLHSSTDWAVSVEVLLMLHFFIFLTLLHFISERKPNRWEVFSYSKTNSNELIVHEVC
jgi:hypothetical protein